MTVKSELIEKFGMTFTPHSDGKKFDASSNTIGIQRNGSTEPYKATFSRAHNAPPELTEDDFEKVGKNLIGFASSGYLVRLPNNQEKVTVQDILESTALNI